MLFHEEPEEGDPMAIQDIACARENVRRYRWAQSIVEGWKQSVAYAMQQERAFFEDMIPELTPWPEYGQNCPVCVGRLSSMGETGIYQWDVHDLEKLICRYCQTEYPNPRYPETGSMTAPSMQQTFTFYQTEEERAHPEDTSGTYAFKWVNYPVHTSWRGILRSKKSGWCFEQMVALAKLYAITGEVKYAERAAWIMDCMAHRYPNWLFHAYDGTYADCPPAEAAAEMGRHPEGGKFPVETIITAFSGRHHQGDYAVLCNGFWGAGRFGCSGSDGGAILQVVLAYDLIREAKFADGMPVLTAEMDQRIGQDLILAGCEDTEHWDDINNKCGKGRALSGAVGIMFEGPASVRRAIEGLEALMDEAFHVDGFCTESPSYSDMHLNVMRDIPEILKGYSDPEGYEPDEGLPLRDLDPFRQFDRYRLALESMVRMLGPDMCYPVIGDTHAGGGLNAIHAEILAAHYGPHYAGLLEQAQGGSLEQVGSEYALWHRDPDLKVGGDVALPLSSEWFPGWHVAVLRGGAGQSHTAFYLNGYAHGGHRHYDTLGIIYMAHAQEMAADRGYIWDDPRNAWTRSTLSHNIVTVDGMNQDGASCHSTLELFGRGPGVEIVQASANAYEHIDQYQRTCALVQIPGEQTIAVDFFRVQGGKRHQYGFHCNGQLLGITGGSLEPVSDEIEWLTNLRAARQDGPFAATWEHQGVRMDLMLLNPIERLLVANAPGWRSDGGSELNAAPVQQILAERTDANRAVSQYASVIVPYTGEDSPVKLARLILDDSDSGAMAVAVEREGGTDYIISSPDRAAHQYGPIAMTGHFGFVSVDTGGRLLRAYLLDGTELSYADQEVLLSEARIPLEAASAEGPRFHLKEDVPVDMPLAGKYLLAGDTGYEIESTTARTITVRDYPAVECDVVELLNSVELVQG